MVLRTRPVALVEQARHLAAAQGQKGGAGAGGEEVLDLIDYGLATQMLKSLGVESVTLATDCKKQKEALVCCGVTVAGVHAAPAAAGEDHHQSNGKATGSSGSRPLELSSTRE